MTQIPTPFGSSAGKYNFIGTTSLENCHAEIRDDGGKARFVIVPSDGSVEWAEPTDSPCRGMIFLEDLNLIYSFHESSSYKTDSTGTSTRVDTIPGIDTVQVTRNNSDPPQITILTEAGLYFIEADAVSISTDGDLPTAVSVETLGEFTLYGIEDGRVFYSTQGATREVDALDFFTAEQSPDKLIRLKVDRGELFIFSQRTIENWNFTGTNPDAPFEFRTLIPKGILARDSVASFDGSLGWIGDDAIVYRLEGFTPKRISNHEVERLIQGDASQSMIKAWTYSRGGHTFYVLKGTNWTRSYDAATGQWHRRKSNALDVWRCQFSVSAFGKTILGDQSTGKLLSLDDSLYTEDGDLMAWEAISPVMMSGRNGGIVDRLWIDFLTGQGAVVSTAQGYDPTLMLSYSDDGGNTWSNARHLNCGRSGNYRKKVETWRLGKFTDKGRVWKLRMTDPVGRALALLDATVRPMAA